MDEQALIGQTTVSVMAGRSYLRHVRQGLSAVERVRGRAVQLLDGSAVDAAWLERVGVCVDELLVIGREHADLGLYCAINEKINSPLRYSALHAVCCALMVMLGARWLDWSEDQVRSITSAALTMNVAMGPLQDQLARQAEAPSREQRELIDRHAQRAVEMLEQAGVSDEMWLHAVREHHVAHQIADAEPVDSAARAAELLRRVDIYAAKLSPRRMRAALTPAIAARGALLGVRHEPDAIGATLLRVLGLYPPGVYVELASGEVGVVIERGSRAHTPVVVVLRRPEGNVLLVPQARDTALGRFAVRRGVDATQVSVGAGHAKVLSARLQLGLPPSAAALEAKPGSDAGTDADADTDTQAAKVADR